jgi:hypothetical protein
MQDMAEQGCSLGLQHDTSRARSDGTVKVWVKDTLHAKVLTFISDSVSENWCLPGRDAKLYGCLNLLDTGTFGKVARGGLGVIKDSQHCKTGTHEVTDELWKALEVEQALMTWRTQRVMKLRT